MSITHDILLTLQLAVVKIKNAPRYKIALASALAGCIVGAIIF